MPRLSSSGVAGVSVLVLVALVVLALFPGAGQAQQLEPRRWSHLPTGVQFLGAGYIRTDGDILLDPALKVEDATVAVDSLGLGYVRSFELAGRTARLDVDIPYWSARWEGLIDGEPRSREVDAFGDPRLRFSVLLKGGPALDAQEFSSYQAANPVSTIIGAGMSLILPAGSYDRTKLLNISGNRLVLRPEFGIVHTRNRWSFEVTGSLSLYQDNDEFAPGGSTREQDPLFLLQGHTVYTFRPGLWVSVSGGYGFGGESSIDAIAKDDDHENYFAALTLGIPLSRTQGIKIAYAGLRTGNIVGSDTNSVVVAWTMMF